MKKLFVLLVAVVFASCSQDQDEILDPVGVNASLSVLDGNLLSFKDDKSFIKDYSALTEMKSGKEVQAWITKKGLSSLLNKVDTTKVIQEKIDYSAVIYSDALKAIVNEDSKFKINGRVIWLNQRNLYVLNGNDIEKSAEQLEIQKNNLEIFGKILSSKQSNTNSADLTSRTIPNANRSIGWSYNYNYGGRARRIDLTLFNETIMFNGDVQSTKMFLRCQRLGRYCSVWKCRWNSDNGGNVYLKIENAIGNWGFNYNLLTSNFFLGYQLSDLNNTVMLADGSDRPIPFGLYPDNFVLGSGFMENLVVVNLLNDTNLPANPSNIISWGQIISWY